MIHEGETIHLRFCFSSFIRVFPRLLSFIASVSTASCHTGHDVMSDIDQCMSEYSQRISKEVIDHIFRFREEGLRDVNAICAVVGNMAKYFTTHVPR